MITSAKNDIILHIDQSVEKVQNSINAATIAREPNVNASTNVNTMRDTLIESMSNNNRFKEFRIKQPKRRNGEYAPDKVKPLFKQELEGKYSMEHVISVLYKEFDDQCVEVIHTYIEMLKQQNSEDMPVWSNISPHNRRVMCSIVSDAAIAYSESLAFLNDSLSESIFDICTLQKLGKTELARQKKRNQVEEKNDNYDNEEDDDHNDNQEIAPSTIITRSKNKFKK
ncbi:hypothetical protein INT46_011788 [Mucor plumbeus]|uniref:Uncharacterized protein n=1 Tax=Mucor plumbeus TaxID=97098 RepID=A0A8H7UMA5_9FUNG|nr:hypothetical protein INT46_011788 [Mucor plumbeus]